MLLFSDERTNIYNGYIVVIFTVRGVGMKRGLPHLPVSERITIYI